MTVAGVGLLILVAGIYFAPTILAMIHGHRYTSAICVINLFLGWTLIGWVGALAWAFAPPREPQATPEPPAPKGKPSLSIHDQAD